MYQNSSNRPHQDQRGPPNSQDPSNHASNENPQGQRRPRVPAQDDMVFDGKSLRKSVQRKTVDYNASQLNFFETRPWYKDTLDFTNLQPDPHFAVNMLPPTAQKSRPSCGLTTKWVSTSSNKVRCPANVVRWTPEGRRLISGCSTGEFTLWNGLTFNFETILQAHESAVRAMEWSHNDNWMVTAEHNGIVKYWQSNMNNLKEFQAHESPIRDLSFSCSDAKFATCSDDSTIKVWDFNEGTLESTLLGHASDVKCIDWHPHKSLIASGSRDHMLKMWDPKTGKGITTLHNHKSSILSLEWNKNGNWLVTTARDQLIKVFDIRAMKEFHSLRGHKKEVSAVAWHPHFERSFATGGSDGAILFWDLNSDSPVEQLRTAHDNCIWSLDWHPVGHILVSGSNDHTTRFWTRPRPGEVYKTKEARFHANELPPIPIQEGDKNKSLQGLVPNGENEVIPMIPGLGRAAIPMPLGLPPFHRVSEASCLISPRLLNLCLPWIRAVFLCLFHHHLQSHSRLSFLE
ncbi:pre-mRNA cleavage and polyadenylation factor (CPF) complex subunit [Entomophthora muscae]|uniref:Pre-mRNA cleavage and polyadenylation factor (CPF) complex subunit n=1 Tax=Entomophthora muscae TaxID=34485 RepID=A0ACC2RZ28_9FUNG|nr:pre-mRNA cleavage and polyadenylation factor (CPF) complex subunit [Entomophthora muscae]